MQITARKLIELQQIYRKRKSYEGFTLLEILVVLLLAGIMAAMSAPYISFGINPLPDTTNRLAGNIKLMRAKAMAETSAYRMRQISETQLIVERGRTCFDSTWIVDPSFTPEDISLAEAEDIQGMAKNAVIRIVGAEVNRLTVTTLNPSGQLNWELCFNSRGMAGKNVRVNLKNIKTNDTKQIEVFGGGGVQIY